MFGKKKEIENKVTNIEIESLNTVSVKVTTDEGEARPFVIVTNLDDSELKQLFNDFIAERGTLDLYLDSYLSENGYEYDDLKLGIIESKGIKAMNKKLILK